MVNVGQTTIIIMVAAIVAAAGFVVAYNQLIVASPPMSSAINERNFVVVTSIAPIANIIKNVGSEKVDVVKIVPSQTASHTFKLSVPESVIVKTKADLVIINGLSLDTTIEDAARQSENPQIRILKLAENTIGRGEWVFDNSFPEENGNPNPHLWLDVEYAMKYAELIRDELSLVDPKNAEYYDSNTDLYLQRLKQLDQAIIKSVNTIPEENRKLVTYHDSFPYFAKRYGLEVIAAIQPTDFREPTDDEVLEIVAQIKAEKVPAIFGSEVFPASITGRIADAAGIEVIRTLRDDVLPGDEGASQHTYVGMMVANVRTIVTALGGDASMLEEIDPSNTYEK